MVKIDRLPSGTYRARVLIGNGKYKTFTGKDKKAVQLQAAEFEAIQDAEPKKRTETITVEEALNGYIESKKNVLSPKTYREYYRTILNSFNTIKSINVFDITQLDIQNEINIEAAKSSPKTVRNKHGLLSSTIAMYRPELILHTTLPQKKKPDIVIPTEEHMMKLFKATYGTEIELPILLGSIAGLRMSEVIGLRWRNIDFKNNIITIDTALVRDVNNNFVLKSPKSHAGFRTVKILPQVYNALKRLYNPEKEFITELKSYNIYNRYQTILKQICPEAHYTFHELRHYAASVMIMLGIPVKYIADMLGHETEDMVNKVYGHIMVDKKDIFFDKLCDYYNDAFKKYSFENLS